MDTPNKQTNPRKLLFLISGMGALALGFAFLLIGGNLFGSSDDDLPVTDVSTFPAVNPTINDIIDVADQEGAIQVGEIAPNFVLNDLNGDSFELADFRGRPVIINFWASWCGPCRIEMPELEATFQAHADDELAILAINREEDPDTVQDFFYTEMNLSFTPLLDSDAAVAEGYGVFNMPTTYFVNAAGEVTAVHRGPLAQSQIDGYLALTLP